VVSGLKEGGDKRSISLATFFQNSNLVFLLVRELVNVNKAFIMLEMSIETFIKY